MMSSRKLFPELEFLLEIRSRRDLEGQSSEEEEIGYALYESPCLVKASNEEFSPETIDGFDLCELDFYGGCLEDASDLLGETLEEDLFELNIYYDYELYYRNMANPQRTIKHLEGAMLEHLASVLRLSGCDEGRRRIQYQHDFSDDQLDSFVGISSDPADLEDADFVDCIVPVAKSRAAGATCLPVTGIVTVFLRNDPAIDFDGEVSITSGVMRLIRWGMEEDLYLSGNAQHAAFIGTRIGEETNFDSVRQTETGPADSTNNLSSTSKTLAIVGSLAAIVLLVAIVLFVVARPARDREAVLPESDPEDQLPMVSHAEPAVDHSEEPKLPPADELSFSTKGGPPKQGVINEVATIVLQQG